MSGTGRRNRLAAELSPYLLLHQHNPVVWYPWGDEALDRARREDKPIFLSVGYSTCFWCHVMERESFADAGTAALMNEHFVNIKLDREERPELDEIYMSATQLLTHQGGWPNSVFLTPSLKPFFAGTYFPPREAHGRPSFRTVLLSMHEAWVKRRAEVDEQAEELAVAMRDMLEERGRPTAEVAGPEAFARSLAALERRFDPQNGGFGSAPKFPTPGNLLLLLEAASSDAGAATMLDRSLDAMAEGGFYDQLAGGFHRYATDAAWKVPHFEKMLYDNGLLLEIYARDFLRTGDPERARIVRETAVFLARELSAPEGGLWSAIDAEIGGHEGGHHVWTLEQLTQVLGEEDAAFLAPIFGFSGMPFFEGRSYVLHLPISYREQAQRRRLERAVLLDQVEGMKQRLLAARLKRPLPLVDDKVLTDWNGIALAGLAVAARALDDRTLLEQARQIARFLLENLRDADGRLLHSYRGGQARIPAFLADYGFFVRGLLRLHEASGEERWLEEAIRLTHEQVERLGDRDQGGFFVAGAQPDVLFRSKEVFDGALPAANALAVLNLLELAEKQPSFPWLEIAEQALKAFSTFAARQPEGARTLTIAIKRWHGRFGVEPELEKRQPVAAAAGKSEIESLEDVVDGRVALAAPDPQGWQAFRLELAIKSGWHLPAANLGEGTPLLPTSLDLLDGELRNLKYPPGQIYATGGLETAVYQGELAIFGELRVLGDEPVLVLDAQPCDDQRCLVAGSVGWAIA
jgi:uncharacterized protein